MNIFKIGDYQIVIKRLVEGRKLLDPNFTYEKLAEKIKVPKSYLSRVLSGKYDLSADQAFLLTRVFELTTLETDFFVMLVEFNRSATPARREYLRKKLQLIVDEQNEVRSHIQGNELKTDDEKAGLYYGDPHCQTVHICMAIDRFREKPGLLLEPLRISASRLEDILRRLERCQIIKRSSKGIELVANFLHLPKGSPLFPLWQSQQRATVFAKMLENLETTFDVNAVFSADDETFTQVREILLETLTRIQTLSNSARHNDAYQLAINFFSWTKK